MNKNKMLLYIGKDEKLHIKVYTDEKYENSFNIVSGRGIDVYADRIAQFKLRNIRNGKNDGSIILEYDNFYLKINDYQRVLSRENVSKIRNSIKKFLENEKIKKTPAKKVTRKNKHTNRKVIIVGISIFLFSNIFGVNQFSKVKGMDKDDSNEIIITLSEQPNNIQVEEDNNAISINYSDRSNTEKAQITKNNYSEIIDKYAKMYGLDSKLVTAIATQERGIHSPKIDAGGATGLMQIQNKVWLGKQLSAYNFDKGEVETITIDEDKISDVSTNIKIGCMILQNDLRYMKYNILAAIQCYNMGYGNMMKILNEYSSENGLSVEDVLNNANDIGWLNNRDLINVGDRNYIENVLSWAGSDISFEVKKNDGTVVVSNINNENNITKVNN